MADYIFRFRPHNFGDSPASYKCANLVTKISPAAWCLARVHAIVYPFSFYKINSYTSRRINVGGKQRGKNGD